MTTQLVKIQRQEKTVTRLIQHDHQHDPWKVLVCCLLLNRTGGMQVRAVLDTFFRRWPDPRFVVEADEHEMREVVRSLGFYNRRVNTLKRFSHDFITKEWEDPRDLYGIGLYGWEAYQIVCLGNSGIKPSDKVLAKYLEYAEGTK